jgi:hypothetical protein
MVVLNYVLEKSGVSLCIGMNWFEQLIQRHSERVREAITL